jgi:hypothetical protein
MKLQPGTGHEVPHGTGHNDFVWLSLGGHTRADMHGDATHLAIDYLALTGVQPRSYV